MANGKPGRPRGPNYEKNLQKRLRAARNRQSQAQRAREDIREFKDSRMYALAKSMFHGVQAREQEEKKPVFTSEEQSLINQGIRLRNPDRPSFNDLRKLSYSNTLVGAIHKVRIDDLGQFGRPFREKEGFDFDLEDPDKSPGDGDKELIRDARKFFEFMGDKVEGWQNRDRFHAVFQFMIRDTLAIDSVAFYLVRNRRGQVVEVKYLDPATIYPTIESGYKNDPRIRWVQIVNSTVVETFTDEEIIVRHQNELSDVRYRNSGLSPAEVSVMEIIATMNALKFNRDRFSNNPPPGFLYLPGNMPQEVLDDLQVQWENMFSGNNNNHRIPLITSEAQDLKFTNLNTLSDMAFEKLMQWVTTFTLAAHGMDQAELGLRLMGSQGLSEGSMDGRIDAAMTRAKKSMLSYFADVCNDIKETVDKYEPLVFVFNGVEKEDEDKRLERDEKLVKSIELMDEVRTRRDMPTVGEALRKIYGLPDDKFEQVKYAGAVVMDTNWIQSGAQLVQNLAGGAEGDMGMPPEASEQQEFDFEDYDPSKEENAPEGDWG